MNSTTSVEIKGLHKVYKNFIALDNVSFSIKEGEIFGLIGQNGAGKTTLMKIITGSISQTSGSITIQGTQNDSLNVARKHMGSIIEHPSYYSDMTAFENIEIIRLAKGITNRECVHIALETVGLGNVATKKVSKFSLGMRQRLGIAMALIGTPKFLILDEPTNGLDPNGIIEMRKLIQHLNKEYGITILISSHILTELNQIATQYGILHKGKLIGWYKGQELEHQCIKRIIIKHDDRDNIVCFINKYGVKCVLIDKNTISIKDINNLPKDFLSILVSQKFKIHEYYTMTETLEDYFVRVIKE